ncbi:MAG: GNAT family N-acetyltransferase, partial [Pseudomonadota bacterium]
MADGAQDPVRVVRNDDAYRRYISGHEDATPFHRPEWGAAIAAATGHETHHFTALRGDVPVGALPLTEIRSRLFGKSLVSSGFAVGGGPLFEDAAALAALDAAAWDHASKAGIATLEYRTGEAVHQDWPRKTGVYAGFVRPIHDDTDANLKAIPRKQRAEVRKSLKLGLDVRIGRDETDLRDHYEVYATSVRNLGTPVFPRALFRDMLAHFGEDADILTVSKDGTPVASVLSFYQSGTVYPYWGGGTVAARGLRANEHMYWMLMEHARTRG